MNVVVIFRRFQTSFARIFGKFTRALRKENKKTPEPSKKKNTIQYCTETETLGEPTVCIDTAERIIEIRQSFNRRTIDAHMPAIAHNL